MLRIVIKLLNIIFCGKILCLSSMHNALCYVPNAIQPSIDLLQLLYPTDL